MAYFRSGDGLEIAYHRWGSGDAVPVVLHHGFGASAEVDWVQTGVVSALVDAGRSVVAIDARGHGQSEKPHDPVFYGEGRMAADLLALIEVLGVPLVDLVGYSMGAVVSLLTATRSDRVRRLVVGGIGASTAELGGVDISVLAPDLLREALLTDDPASIPEGFPRMFRTFADATGADRLALAAQASARHHERIALERISAPTLVLAGRDDPLASRPEVLSAAIPGAELRAIPGDHGGALQVHEFRNGIVDFLGG